MFGEDVSKMDEIQYLINSMYFNDVWIIKMQFYIFLFGFMIPFLLQIRPIEGLIEKKSIMWMNICCMITQSMFVLQELKQISIEGKGYFTQIMNYAQWMMFVLYF